MMRLRSQIPRMATALTALLLLAGCGVADGSSTVLPAASPSDAATSPAATQPAATQPAATTAAPSAAATSPASTQPAASTPAIKPVTATPSLGATTAPVSVQAEPWQIEGKAVLQATVAGERHYYVTTEDSLYSVNGDVVEQRASGGVWPNLVTVTETTLLSGQQIACGRGEGGAPLRRSTDGGRTWNPVQVTGSEGLQARPIPTLGDDLFAVACDGLYRSTDDGATWAKLAVLEADNEPVDVATTPDGQRLYIVSLFGEGGTTRLLVSQREGASWGQARKVNDNWGGGIVTIGQEQGRDVVYFATPLGVQLSRDDGASWQPFNTGLDSTILLKSPLEGPLPPEEEAKLSRAVGIYSIVPATERQPGLLGGSDGLYVQVQGGWQKSSALADQLVREVFYDLQGTAYARTDLGLFRLSGL